MGKRKLPFGYRIRNGQIQTEEHEAEVVRMIFDCYAAGMSYGRLTDKLNGQDISYVPGKSWNINMVISFWGTSLCPVTQQVFPSMGVLPL